MEIKEKIMKRFEDLISGDKVFSFNKNNRGIFIDEIIDIQFNIEHVYLRLRPILNADGWIGEFNGSFEKKYLNQFSINNASAFISPDEELFFDYINESIQRFKIK